MSKLLIIIPAHNEEESIGQVVENVMARFPQHDYIVVNDGSSDNTAEVCRSKGYRLIDLPVNIGVSGAVQTGLLYAYKNDYDYAIQVDGDGQHRAEYIPPMLDLMQRHNHDIVIASRFLKKKKHVSLRMVGSSIISAVIQMTTGKRITDPTSGMRLYNRKMIAEYAHDTNYDQEPDTIAYLLNHGVSISELQVDMDERKYGQSFFNFTNSVLWMMRMLVSILVIQWARKRKPKQDIAKKQQAAM